MSSRGSKHAGPARQNLAQLIAGIGDGRGGTADDVVAGIHDLIHSAAVGLLHSVLPPMVHARNAATRVGAWTALEDHTAQVRLALTGAHIHNAVLAGEVARTVEQGVGRITANIDYAGGVNSIA